MSLLVNTDLKDVDRLYLLEVDNQGTDALPPFFVPGRLAPAATEKYPNVFERCYRFYDRGITISKDDNNLRIQSMIGIQPCSTCSDSKCWMVTTAVR